MRARFVAAVVLLGLLSAPTAAACSVVSGTRAEGRFALWDPASGGLLRYPALGLRIGGDPVCEPVFPAHAFDGKQLAWIDGGRVRLGDRQGGVASPFPAEGAVAGLNGTQLLIDLRRDGPGEHAVLDLATGSTRALALPPGRSLEIEGSRVAWLDGATLEIHEALTGARVLQAAVPLGNAERSWVVAHGPRWVAGWATFQDAFVLWAFDAAEGRLVNATLPPGVDPRLAPREIAVALDAEVLVVEAPRGDASWLWRARLPNGTLEAWAPVPAIDGVAGRSSGISGGFVALAAGRLVGPLIPLDGAHPIATILAAAVGSRLGRNRAQR